MLKFIFFIGLILGIESFDCDSNGRRCNVYKSDNINLYGNADRFNVYEKRELADKTKRFTNRGHMDRTDVYEGKRSADKDVAKRFTNYGVMNGVTRINASNFSLNNIVKRFENWGHMDRTNVYEKGKRSADKDVVKRFTNYGVMNGVTRINASNFSLKNIVKRFENWGHMDRTNVYEIGKRSADKDVVKRFTNYGHMSRTDVYEGKRSADKDVVKRFTNYGVMNGVKKIDLGNGILNNTIQNEDKQPFNKIKRFTNYGHMDRTDVYEGKRSADIVK